SRSIKNLRSKYDSMKKEVRKSVAKQKKYVTGTGGGPFIGEAKLSPALEQLHQNIKLSSDGLICQFDSDSTHINLKSTDELDFGIMMEEIDDPSILEENILEENNSPSNSTDTIRVNFSDYSAAMLQTAKPKELKRKISTDIVVDQVPTTRESLFEKSSSLEQTRISFSKKKKSTVSSVATKYNDLCTSKAELVERELKLLGKKEQEDTIEHQLRTKKLKLEIEKLELEILLLKKST
ncbi:myb/SANT-like DNA-binding domain-containing protein 4, partial [Aphis craccivora]